MIVLPGEIKGAWDEYVSVLAEKPKAFKKKLRIYYRDLSVSKKWIPTNYSNHEQGSSRKYMDGLCVTCMLVLRNKNYQYKVKKDKE
jgi:hypothetical protein